MRFLPFSPNVVPAPAFFSGVSPVLARSYHGDASLTGISHSDGHVVFKVHLPLHMTILAKIFALSRISIRMEKTLKNEYFHAYGRIVIY
jgi:hypothetical protein